ncbi:hypothetical protein PanWU01x14_365720, partial [Parasponia andersonii]
MPKAPKTLHRSPRERRRSAKCTALWHQCYGTAALCHLSSLWHHDIVPGLCGTTAPMFSD